MCAVTSANTEHILKLKETGQNWQKQTKTDKNRQKWSELDGKRQGQTEETAKGQHIHGRCNLGAVQPWNLSKNLHKFFR